MRHLILFVFLVLLAGCKTDIYSADEHGNTQLHQAVVQDNIYRVQLLLKRGAHVNIQNDQGKTPLHFAFKGDVEIVDALLFKKAQVNIRDTKGNTPLHIAAIEGNFEAIQMLLEAGAKKRLHNNDGYTPVDLAITYTKDQNAIDSLRYLASTTESASADSSWLAFLLDFFKQIFGI